MDTNSNTNGTENAEDYPYVVAEITGHHRVVAIPDRRLWTLQRSAEWWPPEAGWREICVIYARDHLIKACTRVAGANLTGIAALAQLPRCFPESAA